MKIRKPQRICLDNVDWSSEGLVNGFFGKNQAVTIVVRAETRGPLNWYGEGGEGGASCGGEHDTSSRHIDTKTKRQSGAALCLFAFLSICLIQSSVLVLLPGFDGPDQPVERGNAQNDDEMSRNRTLSDVKGC